MPGRDVYRHLHLTTPGPRGDDVLALQQSINARLTKDRLAWLLIGEDGELGSQTLAAADLAAFAIGLDKHDRDLIRAGTVTESVQRKLRDPAQRGQREKERAKSKRRKDRLAALRKAHRSGPAGAVALAKKCAVARIHEDPSGSNRGPDQRGAPGVTTMERHWGDWMVGQFWCGAAAGFWCNVGGGAKLTSRVTFDLHILDDARNGRNGLVRLVPPAQMQKGDLIIYPFRHIELCVGPVKNGRIHSVGGNTSDDDAGSQNNGGGVFERDDRPVSNVRGVARVRWAA